LILSKISLRDESSIRPLLIAVFFSPVVALLFHALERQQADNLLPAFFSTDHLTWFYWTQARFGNIVPVIAFPIQNIRGNLIIQVLLRVSSMLFVTFWFSQIVSVITSVKREYLLFTSLLFFLVWVHFYTDGGDSLLYGANAHPLALPFVVLAVSCIRPIDISFKRSRGRKLFALALTFVFWWIALWTSILVVLWAPVFILLGVIVSSRQHPVSLLIVFRYIGFQILCLSINGIFWIEIARRGGENSGYTWVGSSDALKSHPYIYKSALIAIALMIAAFIFVRSWRSISLILSSFALLATIYLIAASNHVRAYEFSPRYFAVPLFLGALIPFLFLASRFAEFVLLSSVLGRMLDKFCWTLRYLRISIFVICCISFVFVGATKIGYGSGVPDAIGFNNTGRSIELTDFVEFQNKSHSQSLFISGNYWDVWPTVFELRIEGIDVLAITKKAEFQSDFKSLYTGREVIGICIDTVEKCYGSTINAQLSGQQLLSSIDDEPLMTLSNGIELRLMRVWKP
jgi:hypothetical protein